MDIAKLTNELCVGKTKEFLVQLNSNTDLTMNERRIICEYIGMAANTVYKPQDAMDRATDAVIDTEIYRKRGWLIV